MSLTSEAIAAIVDCRERMQADLDRKATEARAAHVVALRQAILDILPDDPTANLRPVLVLLAASVTIGRESDGYPQRNCPDEVRDIVLACDAAAVNQTGAIVRSDGGRRYMILDYIATEAKEADYKAWSAAEEYRQRQRKLPI